MKSPSHQLALDLPLKPRFGREDFLVSPSNEAAFTRIENWRDWPGRMLLLTGPAGSGKSHLGAIWALESGAHILDGASLGQTDLPALAGNGAILVDDADEAGRAENAFFHLINLMRENAGYLAMTARRKPDLWGLSTPDLLSRLRLAPVAEIEAPDDALVRAVLVKLFIDRQLIVDTSVIEFLAVRIERSLAAARAIVDILDKESLSRSRPVTRPMASAVLARLGEIRGESSDNSRR